MHCLPGSYLNLKLAPPTTHDVSLPLHLTAENACQFLEISFSKYQNRYYLGDKTIFVYMERNETYIG